ncbi:DNA-binding transcription factor [Lithospermum erythrorhizon]|uniref:DNA-binding transcription factor n=1 Tax=Lithospermum erythrorhizon TaxID=34254 RepID=A0AAV3P8I6_LITER
MKTKKSQKDVHFNKSEDIDEELKNDVFSFASSLGLSASDFGKTNQNTPKNEKNRQKKENSVTPQARGDYRNGDKKSPKPHPSTPQARGDHNNADRNSWKTTDKYKNLPKLPLVKANAVGVWHVDVVEWEAKVLGEEAKKVGFGSADEWKAFVEKKKELGERLLAQFVNDYETSRGQSGDIKMLMTTQRSGTAADKVSAFSVLLGDNPVANLRSLDALLGMVTSKVGKRHSLSGFEALQELFVSSLLPDRKLKTLLQRPLNHLPETKDGNSLLLLWYWEDLLKQRYERFVIALEEASRDVLPVLKDKALKTIYTLLRNKSEQERRLLTALVNKLGDPSNKAASNADYLLLKLLSDHPNMKIVVINEVDNLLFRPHLVLKAKYHAVNFLTQIQLSHKGDGPKVAKRLIDVYFALYKVLISEASAENMTGKHSKTENNKANGTIKDDKLKSSSELHVEMDSRLLSALLSGVNRAFPYVSSNEADDIVEVQTPILFQLVHSKNFNVGVQALILLEKISSKNQIVSDRFYRALYAKLLLPAAMNSSKEELFIGLLLKAMKSDINLKRVAAFSKRLLQVALQQPPQYACGCLFLLSEALKARPPLWNMVLQNEAVDDDLEHFEDITEEEEDKSSSVKKRTNNVKDVVSTNNDNTSHKDPSSEEADSSASESEDGDFKIAGSLNEDGFYDLSRTKSDAEERAQTTTPSKDSSLLPGGYNPRHREPSFCNADAVSWWELTVLASHAHPSVATMAKTLLSGANIVYHGNPLQDFTLSSFLDKFMEKKPKKSTWHGASEIEPAKKLDMSNQLIGPEILALAEEDVAAEDLVFHKFYANKLNSSKKLKKKKKKAVEEEDDYDEDIIPMDENLSDSDDDPSIEEDADYDYDDLDKIDDEDDDDLVGNASDGETDLPSGTIVGDLDNADNISADNEDDRDVVIGEADDGSDLEDNSSRRRKTQKSLRRTGASPFASLEEYEDIINEDEEQPAENTSTQKFKHKSKKKRLPVDTSTEKQKSKFKKKRKTST